MLELTLVSSLNKQTVRGQDLCHHSQTLQRSIMDKEDFSFQVHNICTVENIYEEGNILLFWSFSNVWVNMFNVLISADFVSLHFTLLFLGNLIEDTRSDDYYRQHYPESKEWNRTSIDCTALRLAAQRGSILLKACAVQQTALSMCNHPIKLYSLLTLSWEMGYPL